MCSELTFWLKQIGFIETTNNYCLTINIHSLKPYIFTIDKNKLKYLSKEQILEQINLSKRQYIISIFGGQKLNDENKKIFNDFAESLGYIYDEQRKAYIYTKKLTVRGKEYESDSIIIDERLNTLTLNDALLELINEQMNTNNQVSFIAREDLLSVNNFVTQFDCPTCPK